MTRMESDALSIISDGLSAVTEGCRLPVRMKNTEDWPKAEVISIRQVRGGLWAGGEAVKRQAAHYLGVVWLTYGPESNGSQWIKTA